MTTMTTVNIGKRPDPIILTDAAQKKVGELLAQETVEGPLVLRVAVRPERESSFTQMRSILRFFPTAERVIFSLNLNKMEKSRKFQPRIY